MIRRVILALLLAILLPSACLADKGLGSLIGDPYEHVDVSGKDGPVVYNTPDEIQKSTEYTVMLYLCGSSLEQRASASIDLMEIVLSGFPENRLNVVVMAGGAQQWFLPQISAESTEIYQAGNNGIRMLTSDGTLRNMGDPETLSYFLNYTRERFPSDHYGLILWDHGEGSIIGVCRDTNFQDDCLSMEEMRSAFRNSPFAENRLDWIGFDACLMGSAEIAGVVAPHARYMIASEESEPPTGWDYSFLRDLNSDEAPEATGRRIAEQYIGSVRENLPGVFETGKVTMSCIDLDKMETVSQALSGFIPTVAVNRESYPKLSRTRRGMVSFGRNEEDSRYDYDLIDLASMVAKLSDFGDAGKASAVMSALEGCVRVSESSREDCSGLTLYFPFYNKKLFSSMGDRYATLGFSSEYAGFVRDFGTMLTGAGSTALSTAGQTEMEEAHKDNRTVAHLPLSEEQQEEIDVAEIVALQRAEDGEGWRLVATQDAEISPYGNLGGEYVHTNLFLTDADGNPLYDVPLVYVERDDGLLSIPLRLTDAGGKTREARLIGRRDPVTNWVTEETVYLYDDAIGGYSPRLTARLADFAKAAYVAEEKKETWYGEAGNSALRPFSEWETISEEEYSWIPDGSCRLRFVRDYLDPATLAVSFRITDIYNNVYMSDQVNLRGQAKTKAYLLEYDDNHWVLLDKTNFGVTDGTVYLRIQNLTDAEAVIKVRGTELNGEPIEAETEVWGNGPNWGLAPGEEQLAVLSLPQGKETDVRELHMEILLSDPEGHETGKAGVVIRCTGE